jgi:hypothetical protein
MSNGNGEKYDIPELAYPVVDHFSKLVPHLTLAGTQLPLYSSTQLMFLLWIVQHTQKSKSLAAIIQLYTGSPFRSVHLVLKGERRCYGNMLWWHCLNNN